MEKSGSGFSSLMSFWKEQNEISKSSPPIKLERKQGQEGGRNEVLLVNLVESNSENPSIKSRGGVITMSENLNCKGNVNDNTKKICEIDAMSKSNDETLKEAHMLSLQKFESGSQNNKLRVPTTKARTISLPASCQPTLSVPAPNMQRSCSGAKELVLNWVQDTLKDYPLSITNFSSSWADGLAFCALIHAFFPESFSWESLKPEERRENFTLAFKAAEDLANIDQLLEVEDMMLFEKPDWKCVFTYVQSFYRRFKCGKLRRVTLGAKEE